MTVRLAVIGPGRVGSAMARRWDEGGQPIEGFIGRSSASARAAVDFCGAGRVLDWADLAEVAIVFVAVGDAELAGLVKDLAADSGVALAGSLWIHASGCYGPEVFAPLVRAHGVRAGALHPLCPIPDASLGYRVLDGAPASIDAESDADREELARLARCAGMVATPLNAGLDRTRYHAACALAANGATALFGLANRLLEQGMEADDARRVTGALVAGALELCEAKGAAAALSGPVARGDRDVVTAHLAALSGDTEAHSAYVTLSRSALGLAVKRGLLDRQQQLALIEALGVRRVDG